LSTTLPVRWAVAPPEFVADHAADGAVVVGRRLRPVFQLVPLQLPVELVEHDARLDHADAGLFVDRQQLVAVLRPVDHDRLVAALPGQAGAAAPGERGHGQLAADRDRGDARSDGARDHDPDRHLPEVGRVGRVGAAASRVEPDLAVHPAAQRVASTSTALSGRSESVIGTPFVRTAENRF
jgi:hypothetical protein